MTKHVLTPREKEISLSKGIPGGLVKELATLEFLVLSGPIIIEHAGGTRIYSKSGPIENYYREEIHAANRFLVSISDSYAVLIGGSSAVGRNWTFRRVEGESKAYLTDSSTGRFVGTPGDAVLQLYEEEDHPDVIKWVIDDLDLVDDIVTITLSFNTGAGNLYLVPGSGLDGVSLAPYEPDDVLAEKKRKWKYAMTSYHMESS